MTQATLNAGQQAAADGFFSFLFSEEKELIISGAGGVGKTFLMGYLIDEIIPRYHSTCSLMGIPPQYHDVTMTATTNKAAEVLGEATNRPTTTIHSFLGLRVKENYFSGKTELQKTGKWRVHQQEIIFIDECSMIDSALRKCILEGTHKCKIVYVGDHSQLPPVFEPLSPIYRDNITCYELTQPMRNAAQPHLTKLCDQIRETVRTGVFNPIQAIPGVIDWLHEDELLNEINKHFVTNQTESRILAYANATVNSLNSYLRNSKGLPEQYTVGEHLISNSALQIQGGQISVEEPVEILAIDGEEEFIELAKDVGFHVRRMDVRTKIGGTFHKVAVPTDRAHFEQLVKYFAKIKDWVTYFNLKNGYPDLRPRDASTVHKSQGSTYDTIFIDLDSLSTCHQPDIAARLLYVAMTRPSNRVIMYGKLAAKYGGVVE